jgi:phenylpropionate dioxygenase-like ring-hydroxylating dioxygenase large terminal subunit
MNRDRFVVGADCATAEGLPPHAFTDPAFAALEQQTLFARAWRFVPRRTAAELADDARPLDAILSRRGARVPLALGGRPVYLQRDWDGGLHCFPNVCTHAWHALVEGIGRERFAVCPQHGREFDCHGRMTKHPGFQGVPDFPRDADHLRDLPVEQLGPFLFACLGDPAHPAGDLLGPVRDALAPGALDALQRRPQEGEVRSVPGNWKHHAWNYMDKFHIAFIHRAPGGLADAIRMAEYTTELPGPVALQWVWAKDPAHGIDPSRLAARFQHATDRVFALWFLLFPNVTLNFYQWGCSVNLYEPVPEAPGTTRFHWYHWVWDESAYERRESVFLNSQVDAEDVDAMAQVLRGTASGFAGRPRFAPGEEAGPHWFHRNVYLACFE